MNNYIILDSYKYKTVAQSWLPKQVAPSSAEIMLDGSLGTTYGPVSIMTWQGEIIGPVTAPGSGWGTAATLRTSLLKRQQLTMTDHFGTTYTVHIQTRSPERSLSPMWDSPTNEVYFDVSVKGTAS